MEILQKKIEEVEKEKNERLKAYRDMISKLKVENREEKAKNTLSPEEMEKLESKKKLAEMLKQSRK